VHHKVETGYNKKMKDLIVVAGAPGSGKTTVLNILQEKLASPRVNIGKLREFHLKRDWSNATKDEENMTFDSLVYILRNYIKHGYKNVFVEDLEDDKVQKISELFNDDNFLIVSLILASDDELKKRVLGGRDSGYKNVEAATAWNKNLIKRAPVKNEVRLDNIHNDPEKTA